MERTNGSHLKAYALFNKFEQQFSTESKCNYWHLHFWLMFNPLSSLWCCSDTMAKFDPPGHFGGS